MAKGGADLSRGVSDSGSWRSRTMVGGSLRAAAAPFVTATGAVVAVVAAVAAIACRRPLVTAPPARYPPPPPPRIAMPGSGGPVLYNNYCICALPSLGAAAP